MHDICFGRCIPHLPEQTGSLPPPHSGHKKIAANPYCRTNSGFDTNTRLIVGDELYIILASEIYCPVGQVTKKCCIMCMVRNWQIPAQNQENRYRQCHFLVVNMKSASGIFVASKQFSGIFTSRVHAVVSKRLFRVGLWQRTSYFERKMGLIIYHQNHKLIYM